jgi:hypothetical protein
VSPTGNYFKSATTGLQHSFKPTGLRYGYGIRSRSGNYRTKPDAKKQKSTDNLFLELKPIKKVFLLKDAVIQEMSAANVFGVEEVRFQTPGLEGVPFVTREPFY